MRFTPYSRPSQFTWTARKLAAAQSKPDRQALQQDRQYPLLVGLLPNPAPFDIQVETERRRLTDMQQAATMRDFHAGVWKAARRDFFAASSEQQNAIRSAWCDWTGPSTSTYFRYVVDLHTGIMEARSIAFRTRERDQRAGMIAAMRAQASFDLEAV